MIIGSKIQKLEEYIPPNKSDVTLTFVCYADYSRDFNVQETSITHRNKLEMCEYKEVVDLVGRW